MKKLSIFILSTVLIALSACKDKNDSEPTEPVVDQLRMAIIPTFGVDDLVLDQTYITDENYQVQFTDLKCYITDVKNGSNTLCSSALFNFRETGTALFTKPGKPAHFTQLTAYLGVPDTKNHADPTAFATSDPLYLTNANDMHWGWNPGYIFIKVEAKVDTLADGIDNFDHLIIFHVGGNDYLKDLQFPALTWQAAGANLYKTALKFDLKTFLNNGNESIDLKTEHSTHTAAGQEVISAKVMNHFRDAISIY